MLAATSASAWGYVRKNTDGGIAEYWQVSCIPTTIYTYGFDDMTRDEVAKAVGAAAHTWSPSAVTCADGVSHPFLEIVLAMADKNEVPPLPDYDMRNTVLFFSESFRPPAKSPLADTSSQILALTSVIARPDGHIVDADLQVNAIDYEWANRDDGFVAANGQEPYDLQNAVTHEFGHFLGLGHTCWNPLSDLEQPIDDRDAGVPLCRSLPDPSVASTVMFANITGPTERNKRVLAPDDIRAICEIYRSAYDPRSCTADVPADGCACNAGDGVAGVPGGAWPALAGLAIAWCRHRRIRSRPARPADRE